MRVSSFLICLPFLCSLTACDNFLTGLKASRITESSLISPPSNSAPPVQPLSCGDADKSGKFLVSFSTDNIRVHKMTSSTTVDPALTAVQNYPRAYFNSPSLIPTSFFGMAYHNGFLYIAGNLNTLFRVSVTFNAGSMQISNAWTSVTNTAFGVLGNNFYLNNNVIGGRLYSGQIDEGAFSLDLSNWAPSGFESYDLFAVDGVGSKSSLILDAKIFVATDGGDGIYRMDDMLGTNKTNYLLGPDPATESIVTDGTYIYGNDDVTRGRIYKWLPGGLGSVLLLDDQDGLGDWTTPDLGGRIRGLTYDEGCLYASPGASGSDRNIYAIDTLTGAVFDVGVEAASSGGVFGVIVVTPF